MTGRAPPGSALVRLSISATDEEWALAAERAQRQGQSISRCLVAAALADEGAPEADEGGERGLLEAVRRLRPLLSGGNGRELSRSGMQERLAAAFSSWACTLAASGREVELRSVLAPALGKKAAERVASALALERPGGPARSKRTGASKRGPEPSPQGSLL